MTDLGARDEAQSLPTCREFCQGGLGLHVATEYNSFMNPRSLETEDCGDEF
jgi:hypothetical protein